MSQRTVLFVSYGGGHIAMVLPVMRALQARYPDWKLEFLALTTAGEMARREGVHCLTYRDFSHWYDPERLRALSAPLMGQTQHPLVSAEETEAYLGINLADLHDRLGEAAARQLYEERGRWAFHPMGFMRRLMAELKPDVVVATNSPRSEAAALEAASALGIPTLCMVDLFSPPGDPFLERSHYADMLTTINELGRDNLIAGGVPAERIHITGSPAFDSLASPQRIEEAAHERRRMGWERLKVILWAGHLDLPMAADGPEADPAYLGKTVERLLRELVAACPQAALLIRYHPNHIEHFADGALQDRVFWSDPLARPAQLDVQMADIVVVHGSTIGLEAAIAGKSVLSMDNSPSRHISPLSDFGVAVGVPSFDQLVPMVRAAMQTPHPRAFPNQKGAAADKVADLIAGAALARPRTLP